MKNFEAEHQLFLQQHLNRRSGERKGRLERGHSHGEILFLKKVWWPVYDNFDGLHPEYEIVDWRGRSYFGDFAYLKGPLKFIIEIKGYGPHVRDMDRKKYCDELNRELFLQCVGYRVISFAYDDVSERPELCRSLLQMLFNRYVAQDQPTQCSTIIENEVIRLALAQALPLTPKKVANHFDINYRTAVRLLHSLCTKGWLSPITSGAGERIHRYELQRGAWSSIE
ncbi:hypothetical protein [Paenibacillus segetis]|uniref:DUF559 domain-containing protein n=1 Tax=Paenibacillus segetis TaxID=1325360 RepID=A0ABQ1YQS4_9BACL|nr:hypothetical protein [Paenibacillus segetis]GGH32923.1 hypothetical protein GCM10008013_37640 [Paenibacillus segetis]